MVGQIVQKCGRQGGLILAAAGHMAYRSCCAPLDYMLLHQVRMISVPM